MQDDVADAVAGMQRKVESSRTNGEYPPGMEAELGVEFDAILAAMHGDTLAISRLESSASGLRESAQHVRGIAESASRVPGGELFHGLVGRVVGRHTNPIAASVQTIGESTAALVDQIRQLLVAQVSADERMLSGVIAAVLDRLSVIDELVSSVDAMEQRLDQLESAARRTQ